MPPRRVDRSGAGIDSGPPQRPRDLPGQTFGDIRALKTLTAPQIAELVGGRLVGTPDLIVSGVGALAEAGADQVSFLGNPRYRRQVLPSAAGIVLVPEDFEQPPPPGRAWVACADPSAAFARVVAEFAPPPVRFPPGVHPAAVVADGVQVPDSVHVGPNAVLAPGVKVGERTVIGAGVYLGHETRVGADCLIHPNVTIRERCRIGDRVIIHPGTVVGSDGFGYISGPDGHRKIPQVGNVRIDDDVEIGACVAIDRARFGTTWIKRGTKIDNLVQIAHNVIIGEGCLIVAQVGIAGSSRLGRGVVLAGQVGIAGHIELHDGVIVMAQSGVGKDVPPGTVMFGSPAVERKQFIRDRAALRGVAKLKQAVARLQERLDQLEKERGKEG